MADWDQHVVRMPMGNRVNVAEMDSDVDDDDDDDDIVGGNVEAESHGVNDDVEEGDDADDDEDSSGSDDADDVIEDEIVEQFMRTFHNGDYDNDFDNALSSDRAVPLPTTRPTQASYNKPDDWRERNRIGLTNLKRQLQSCIDSVMPDLSGSFDLRLGTNINLRLIMGQQLLMDNEEPIVWHEPILDEYWNRLEAKMNQLDIDTSTDVSGMYIENVEMKKERLAASRE